MRRMCAGKRQEVEIPAIPAIVLDQGERERERENEIMTENEYERVVGRTRLARLDHR